MAAMPSTRLLAALRRRRFSSTTTAQRTAIYSYGEGFLGALGTGNYANVELPTPLPTTTDLTIRELSAGWAHAGFVTEDGDAYVYGRTHSFRDVIRATNMNRLTPWLLRWINAFTMRTEIDTLLPAKVQLPEGEKVKKMVCSTALTFFLTESGKLFTMGANFYGQCGTGEEGVSVLTPTHVRIGEDEPVADIAAGFQHGLVVTTSGNVFSWGKGERGQLGFGTANVKTPQEVIALKNRNVVSVSAGFNHSSALTKDGELFLWGKLLNPKGKDESNGDQVTPRLIKTRDAVRLQECSHFHTTFITEDHRAWVVGRTPSARKETDEYVEHVMSEMHTMPFHLNNCGELKVDSVVKLGKGVDKTAFLTKDGQAFEWAVATGVQRAPGTQHLKEGRTPLLLACANRHFQVARTLLAHDAVVDTLDRRGASALFHACGDGPIDLVRELIVRGADPFQINREYRQTLLHKACRHANVPVVELLLHYGVDTAAVDDFQRTALGGSVDPLANRSVQVDQALLQFGVNPRNSGRTHKTPLVTAAEAGDVDMVALFLRYEPFREEDQEYFGEALDTACTYNHVEVVQNLLGHGARATYMTLCAASRGGDNENVQKLLRLVDTTQRHRSRATALDLATTFGQTSAIKLLLANGEDVNAQSWNGSTGLQSAARSGHAESVEVLLEHGADPNLTDEKGMSALMHAACANSLAVVRALVASGSNVNDQSQEEFTALHIAAMHHSYDVALYLLELGADLHVRDHVAPHSTIEAMARTAWVLIIHGATFDATSLPARTAAVAFLVQWWIRERDNGQALSCVPLEVVEDGLEQLEKYLTETK
ncbi:hypothetical protein Poli38472_006170 [Pythium oligandrum]|uniref:RCC1-like domain-containing protein n=1 Tax=Pythium oligandrum TaxID=41045 RepID=A0A8K1FR76_PYTOL|nr:hypothetical protein Poli38472_006170 [Pythium oligandrum]|eukprot:TMW68702.1 hypothetical protein Poli38472_006170 [Pythium oligandrum]